MVADEPINAEPVARIHIVKLDVIIADNYTNYHLYIRRMFYFFLELSAHNQSSHANNKIETKANASAPCFTGVRDSLK